MTDREHSRWQWMEKVVVDKHLFKSLSQTDWNRIGIIRYDLHTYPSFPRGSIPFHSRISLHAAARQFFVGC